MTARTEAIAAKAAAEAKKNKALAIKGESKVSKPAPKPKTKHVQSKTSLPVGPNSSNHAARARARAGKVLAVDVPAAATVTEVANIATDSRPHESVPIVERVVEQTATSILNGGIPRHLQEFHNFLNTMVPTDGRAQMAFQHDHAELIRKALRTNDVSALQSWHAMYPEGYVVRTAVWMEIREWGPQVAYERYYAGLTGIQWL